MNLLPNPLLLRSAQEVGIGLSHKSERPTFIAVCRLVPQKGVDLLLEAYYAISTAIHSQWRLLIVGEGPGRTALEQRTSDLQLAERIHFLCFQPDPSRYFLDKGCSCCHHGSKGCQTLYWKRWDADLLRPSLMLRQARWKW